MDDSAIDEGSFPQALGRLRVALDDAYVRVSRDLGLTAQQAALLCAAMSPTAVGDLAHALRCDRSNISRLVDRASRRGLLKRQGTTDDARVTLIELTPEGETVARRFLAALQIQTQALTTGWPKRRAQLAAEVLHEISDALDARQQTPSKRRRAGR